jgi:hypothetical protein
MPEPFFISVEWIPLLWKKLMAIRDARATELASIGDTFGDPSELAKYYVQPRCQHPNPADYHEEEPGSVARSPVFDTLNDFLARKFTTRADGKNQLFILSDAGMGKTSLLVMLKLVHLNGFWPPDYHCTLLKLGSDSLEKIRRIPDRSQTVLLLDALDEDPEAWDRVEDRLKEILSETDNFRRVIISCRTQFFPESGSDPFKNLGRVTVGSRFCPIIYLSLFDDHQIEEYLAKRFPDTWFEKVFRRRNEKGLRSESIVLKMESLRFRPLLLAHVEDILDSTAPVWNEYTTYDALLTAWLTREERKSNGRVNAAELFKACTAIAEEMQIKGERHFSRKRLQTLLSKQPELEQLSLINLGGRSLLNRNSRGDYRFSHYTIQEFLMAKAVLQAALRDRTASFRNTDQISSFVALGILAGVNAADLSLVSAFVGSLSDPALLRKVSSALGWDSYAVIAAAIRSAANDVKVLLDIGAPLRAGDTMILDALAEVKRRGLNVAVGSGWIDSAENADEWREALQKIGITLVLPGQPPSSVWLKIAHESVGRSGVRGLFEIDQHRLVNRTSDDSDARRYRFPVS